jgi:hypothetical protein
LAPWLPGKVAENYTHGVMTFAFVLDNFDALSRRTSEQFRPHLLAGAASGFNTSARAAALIADQKRLLGDAGEKAAKGRDRCHRTQEPDQGARRRVACRFPFAQHER